MTKLFMALSVGFLSTACCYALHAAVRRARRRRKRSMDYHICTLCLKIIVPPSSALAVDADGQICRCKKRRVQAKFTLLMTHTGAELYHTGWDLVPASKPRTDVPVVFQDAFKDVELKP